MSDNKKDKLPDAAVLVFSNAIERLEKRLVEEKKHSGWFSDELNRLAAERDSWRNEARRLSGQVEKLEGRLADMSETMDDVARGSEDAVRRANKASAERDEAVAKLRASDTVWETPPGERPHGHIVRLKRGDYLACVAENTRNRLEKTFDELGEAKQWIKSFADDADTK